VIRARVLVAAALVLLAGCRTPLVRGPIGPLDPADARAQALLRELARLADERHALRGTLRLALDGPDGSLRSTQAFVAEQPARLRVEVQGFLAQTIAVLVTDGDRFDLLRTAERTLHRGEVYPGLLFDVARIDLAPDEAVEVLLGVPRTPAGLAASAGQRLADGGARLDLADPTGAVLRSLEWGPDALLRRVEARSAGGALLWSADYADFRPLGSAGFAHKVDIHFPETRTDVRLEFDALELNPPLPDGIFVLSVPGVGALPGAGPDA
jgi:hypothetical protein